VFRKAAKVILLSATVKQPTLQDDLGLDRGEYGFWETGSPFPVKQRPIYAVELGFRINKDVTEGQLAWWVHKMDQIIGPRQDRKGIIHTVSYARAKLVQKLSKYSEKMYVPESSNTRETVAAFLQAGPGAILVSPSVHTGWDFPDEAAEYQIIGKVPYPDTRNGVTKARAEANKSWGTRHAIVTLQQAAGRVNRRESDWAETFILDDSINWLWSSWRSHFSQWFVEAFQRVDRAPEPWPAHRERYERLEKVTVGEIEEDDDW
jgi:Rad3-related DNA helicase